MRVAVITGMGAVTAFGAGVDVLWSGLAAGTGAVGPIRSFPTEAFPVQVAGEVPVIQTDSAWVRAASRSDALAPDVLVALAADGALRDRKVAFALAAAAQAWSAAHCGDAERSAALVLGLGLERGFPEDSATLMAGARMDWSREDGAGLPVVRFRASVDLAGRAVRRALGLRGALVTHVSACAAGALAVAHAAALVRRGEADVVLCGAADSMVNPLGLAGMWRLGALSPRHAADACRPFDRDRDGVAMGEGAAIFVVEDAARARARGVEPLCAILGAGSSQDAYRATAPRPDGLAAARAMTAALADARVQATDVGYINAHGTGTPLNDPAECRAIRRALGPHADRVAVSSIKGAVGHLMAASGAVELLAAALALQHDLLPGTAHLLRADPACDLDLIGGQPRPARVAIALSNSFGFGGQNGCIVLGRTA